MRAVIQRVLSASVSVDENEIIFNFVRASGPGGQNVNKRSTAVQLRFDIVNSPYLSDTVKNKLINISGSKVSDKGILIIHAHRYRTQGKNRSDSLNRFVNLLQKASQKIKYRKKTKPPLSVNEKRLKIKRRRSIIKKQRRPIYPNSE